MGHNSIAPSWVSFRLAGSCRQTRIRLYGGGGGDVVVAAASAAAIGCWSNSSTLHLKTSGRSGKLAARYSSEPTTEHLRTTSTHTHTRTVMVVVGGVVVAAAAAAVV